MPEKDIVSTALLLFSIVIGPAIFVLTIVGYGVQQIIAITRQYREQRYLCWHRLSLRESLPCRNCQYFANDEFLPCAVNPLEALTEAANSCHDFSLAESVDLSNESMSYLRTIFNASPKLKTPLKTTRDPASIHP